MRTLKLSESVEVAGGHTDIEQIAPMEANIIFRIDMESCPLIEDASRDNLNIDSNDNANSNSGGNTSTNATYADGSGNSTSSSSSS